MQFYFCGKNDMYRLEPEYTVKPQVEYENTTPISKTFI